MSRPLRWFVAVGLVLAGAEAAWWWQMDHDNMALPTRVDLVRERVTPHLKDELRVMGFALGDPLFIRIFKETRELELWMKPKGKTRYELWMRWPIAGLSGHLGPKLAEGDYQTPEGFYSVGAHALNPLSTCHLSFNTGFPNTFDQSQGRTGSWIMVHGGRGSVGCFAITDPVIEEVYVIAEAALKGGQQTFPVHVFPFRMTKERMAEAQAESGEWLSFWENLREGYDRFERSHVPPKPTASSGRYVFDEVPKL
jgi:murein L,D-transpeptidase YafK